VETFKDLGAIGSPAERKSPRIGTSSQSLIVASRKISSDSFNCISEIYFFKIHHRSTQKSASSREIHFESLWLRHQKKHSRAVSEVSRENYEVTFSSFLSAPPRKYKAESEPMSTFFLDSGKLLYSRHFLSYLLLVRFFASFNELASQEISMASVKVVKRETQS
jgi:hypothetical protein